MKCVSEYSTRQPLADPSHVGILLPAGFDPTDYLPAGLWKYKDEVRLIAHWIATRSALSYHRDRWIPLRHEYASLLMGDHRRWNRIKPELIQRGALECDELWTRGKKSMGYRLKPPWRDADLEKFSIRAELVDRLRTIEETGSNRECWQPVHFHLEDSLYRVKVDDQAARKWTCRPSSPRQRHAQKMLSLIQAGDPRMSLGRYG